MTLSRFLLLGAAVGLFCHDGLHAQTLPANFAAAGAAYSPGWAGWASYANLISEKGQLYSFTTHDITRTASKPYTLQSSVRTGFATVMRRAGPITVLAFGDAGMSAAGTSLGGAFSGGGVGIVQLGKTNWAVVVAARTLKTAIGGQQQVYEVGFGRIF